MTTIAGVEISEVTIDGEDVIEITVDGDVVWTAVSTEVEWAQEMDTRYLQESSGFANHLISGGTSFVQQGYDHGSVTRGLAGYWPLDEGSGSTATDEALGNDADIIGATWTPNAQVGTYALDFDGVDDLVETPLQPTGWNQVSVSCWAKSHSTDSFEYFVMCSDQWNGNGFNLYFRHGNPGEEFAWTINGTSLRKGDVTGADVWHHVVGTWDGETMRLYVDGSLLGTDTQSADITADVPLLFGDHSDKDGTNALNGALDDIRVYDRTLSHPEINALYKLTEPSVVNPEDTLQ